MQPHEDTATIAIANVAPTADAGGPYTVAEDGVITLSGSATDPAGTQDPLSYAWDLDGDGQYDDATGPTPTFSAAGLDGYEGSSVVVRLRVTDDEGASHTGEATVQINERGADGQCGRSLHGCRGRYDHAQWLRYGSCRRFGSP